MAKGHKTVAAYGLANMLHVSSSATRSSTAGIGARTASRSTFSVFIYFERQSHSEH